MASSELEQLRAEVRRRRAAATRKVARLRRNGVDITGTAYDPRRNIKVIGKYNSKQLASYLREINNFQNRNVGYVPGNNGVPLPKSKVEELKRLQKQYNAIGDKNFKRVADTAIPGKGLTIRERNATIVPEGRRSAQGGTATTPYSKTSFTAANVKSASALEKLVNSFKKKTDPKYLPQAIKLAKKQASAMFDDLGYSGFKKRIKNLTQHQMDILWNHTDFITRVSADYESWKKRMGGNYERYQDKIEEDAAWDIEELIDWAEKQPKKA